MVPISLHVNATEDVKLFALWTRNEKQYWQNCTKWNLCSMKLSILLVPKHHLVLMTTTVISQRGSPQNINTWPSIDLQNCDKVMYEKKDHLHGVSYTDENGSVRWTPVAGRKKKRCCLPEVLLHRFPPEACLRHANQSDPSDSSGSDQDLDDLIPNHAVVTFSLMMTCSLVSALKQEVHSYCCPN